MKKMKGIVAAILLLGMVMAESLTTFAAELPEQNPEASVSVEGIASPASVTAFPSGRFWIKGNGVRLRGTASINGTVNGLLYENNGDWVDLNGRVVTTGNYTWLQVTNSSIGYSGWVEEDYIYWN